MQVKTIKTHKITKADTSIDKIIGSYVRDIPERSVLAVTSKIVAICEGRIVPKSQAEKDDLVAAEANYYLPRKFNPYGFCVSIAHNKLIASAGIDESNGNGNYVLWPKDPQASANKIREFIVKRYSKKEVGVIITDSHVVPFVWGVIGLCLAHSGFEATRNYIGKPDIFGRNLQVTHQSNTEGLAAAADVVMGGAAEQTPLAIITHLPFVKFQRRNPTKQELAQTKISREEDLFWPLFKNASWIRGKQKRS